MKRVSSNLLHLSIYQCVIWGITNHFCPHYRNLRVPDSWVNFWVDGKEKEVVNY